jgi:hypothetical protein
MPFVGAQRSDDLGGLVFGKQNPHKVTHGGFYPNGVNGAINTSAHKPR